MITATVFCRYRDLYQGDTVSEQQITVATPYIDLFAQAISQQRLYGEQSPLSCHDAW